jgi:hypothetical protein
VRDNRSRRLAFEPLEARELLAATISGTVSVPDFGATSPNTAMPVRFAKVTVTIPATPAA